MRLYSTEFMRTKKITSDTEEERRGWKTVILTKTKLITIKCIQNDPRTGSRSSKMISLKQWY